MTAPQPAGGPCWRLRLSLDEFAAFAATVPDAVLPQGFRPRAGAGDLIRDDVLRGGLAARGLLLRDGPRTVLCPQLTGLLRLFTGASTRVELRVHDATGPAGPTWWSTAAAAGSGLGVRLTRAQVRTADGVRDGDQVDVGGFPAPDLAAQVVAGVPARALSAGDGVRSLWLAVHTAAGTAVDTWWDDGAGWRRVRPDGDGGSTQVPVDAGRLRRDLVDHLAGAVSGPGVAR